MQKNIAYRKMKANPGINAYQESFRLKSRILTSKIKRAKREFYSDDGTDIHLSLIHI